MEVGVRWDGVPVVVPVVVGCQAVLVRSAAREPTVGCDVACSECVAKRVICFEPSVRMAGLLQRGVEVNGLADGEIIVGTIDKI